MTFWRNFHMILHGFAPKNQKHIKIINNTYFYIENGPGPKKCLKDPRHAFSRHRELNRNFITRIHMGPCWPGEGSEAASLISTTALKTNRLTKLLRPHHITRHYRMIRGGMWTWFGWGVSDIGKISNQCRCTSYFSSIPQSESCINETNAMYEAKYTVSVSSRNNSSYYCRTGCLFIFRLLWMWVLVYCHKNWIVFFIVIYL